MLQRVMSRFSVETFLSHSTETLRRGTLICGVSEDFRERKSLWIRGRGRYQDFFSKNFVSQCRKKIAGGPIRESVIAGDEKFYASEGYVTIFRRNFFVSQHRNFSQRNPSMLCIREFPVAKKIR